MCDMVIYHANCADGFCAAWLLHRQYPNADYIPAHYGGEPPDVKGRIVVIADFSYPRDVLEKMKKDAYGLVVLDHHKTAQEALAGLDYAKFDMSKSGAMLTWDWLVKNSLAFSDVTPSWLVNYTQDRDLWKWELPGSREVNAAIRSYPFDFAVWDELDKRDTDELFLEGESILRYQQQVIDGAVKNAREVTLDGYKVLALNSTTLISEIAGELAEGRPFGVCWFERQDGARVYSLRSREGGIDVSEIAKAHGGGGHPKAAGLTVAPSLLG